MTIDLPISAAPLVSVIVVATAGPDLLDACLRSVADFGPEAIPFETIVVLNEPSPNAVAELRSRVSGVHVESSPVNLGIAGAGNRGRASARGELLILLHDDSVVEAGWMEALVATADEHSEAGAIGGKVLHPDGRLQSAGMILWSNGYTSPPWVGEAPAATAFDRVRAVDYCGSSSLLVRAAAWDAVGGLDEDLYPVYNVDVDLGLSLRELGLVVLYQPASHIRHHQGASGAPHFRKFSADRNRQRLVRKWGAALEQHEPDAMTSTAGVARAMDRAEAFAETCRRRGPPKVVPHSSRQTFDRLAHELKHYEKNRAFQRDFVAHLSEALGKFELRARMMEPDYFVGQEIDFSNPILSRRFLIGTWGETETGGVRMMGGHAGLSLRLRNASPGRLALKALMRPHFAGADQSIHACVRVAGRQIGIWTFSAGDSESERSGWRAAIIPARIVRENTSPLEISFHLATPPASASPGVEAAAPLSGLILRALSLERPATMTRLDPTIPIVKEGSIRRRP